MIGPEFDLKLVSGKVVTWSGATGEEAARRYVDANPTETVLAFRRADRRGLLIGLRPIEDGPRSGKDRL